MAHYNGRVCSSELVRQFLEYYPNELLTRLGCEIKNPQTSWLLRLLHSHKADVAQHPIRHILFLTLMGYSAEDVLDSFVEFKPFGDGPWPCLNRASDHYREPRVVFCQVTHGEKKNKGKPVAAFACSCGFVYTRTGPDQAKEECMKWTSVRSYGPLWESRLTQLWKDTSLTLRRIAKELGVNILTVKRRAISLKLAFPRPRPGGPHRNGKILDRYRIKSKAASEVLNIKRKALLSLVKGHPQANRTALQRLGPSLIYWLRRWDRKWLETALPKPKQKHYPRVSVDWEERDVIFSRQVEEASLQIHSVANPPNRVSLTAIVKIVGHRAWIERKLDKMPRTTLVLAENVESFHDHTIRRIRWAAESFRNEGVQPSRAMLANRAGARGRLTSKSMRVQSALAWAFER